MIKTCCDFCDKEIINSVEAVVVTAATEIPLLSHPDYQEYHFHADCFTRLRNKVNAFIAEKGGEIIGKKEDTTH